MTTPKRTICAVLCLAIAALLAGCGESAAPGDTGAQAQGPGKDGAGQGKGAAKGAPLGAPSPGRPVSAHVVQVSAKNIPIRLEAVGQVEGSKEVEVRARVGGTIEKRLYAEGELVKAGTPLFQIDPAPFEIALAQARALLAQERARNEQARRESGRLKELAAQKAISQREYDDAVSGLKLSEASMQMAEARVREAELNLSWTRVTAPLSGMSGRAQRSEGSLVSTADSLLTTITQLSPVWVRFAFADSELAKLPGARLPGNAPVRLVLADGSRYGREGRINFTASQIDARLGTRQMRAEFDNPQGTLLPGQFVRVEVAVARPPVFLVPQAAVLQNEKGQFVFTLDAAGKAAIRPVRTAEWVGSDWVVQSGLAAGDRVVTDNLFKLQPGVAVQPLEGAAQAAPAQGAAARGAAQGAGKP
jgi:membrane fusion protein (multidrug efflux system)